MLTMNTGNKFNLNAFSTGFIAETFQSFSLINGPGLMTTTLSGITIDIIISRCKSIHIQVGAFALKGDENII